MQLSILKPNIIVCSGWPINEFVRGMFLKENLYIQGNNLAYCHKTKTLIILGYHPTAPFINTRQHFAGTMEHYKKLLDTKYGKEFIASLMD
jgi:hypothetical protein